MKSFILVMLMFATVFPLLAGANSKSEHKITQISANAKSSVYINTLVESSRKGDVVKLDELKGLAAQGDANAQGGLSRIYANGWGERADYSVSLQWAHKAADQGNPDGMNVLGFLFSRGLGVTQNNTESLKWIRKAGELGHLRAQGSLGDMYRDGKGVAQDDVEAVRWYRKAAEQGEVNSMNRLGFMYSNGRGVAQDDALAIRWYRKAADQGEVYGQFNTGSMYARGKGVPQDDAQAMYWYHKAAEQGNADAQGNIKFMVSQGRANARDDAPKPIFAAPSQIHVPTPIAGNSGKYRCPYTAAGAITAWARVHVVQEDNGSDVAGSIGGVVGERVANKVLDFVPFGLGGMIGKSVGESTARSATRQKLEPTMPTLNEIVASSDISFASSEELSVYMYAKHSSKPEYQRVLELAMKVYPEMQVTYASSIDKASQSSE